MYSIYNYLSSPDLLKANSEFLFLYGCSSVVEWAAPTRQTGVRFLRTVQNQIEEINRVYRKRLIEDEMRVQ